MSQCEDLPDVVLISEERMAEGRAILAEGARRIALEEAGVPDPGEEWRCGTCAYWRKPLPERLANCGRCTNIDVMERVMRRNLQPLMDDNYVYKDFGCRFWSRKPLEDNAS